MKLIKTSIPDILLFEPKVFGDKRGYFTETFRQDFVEQHLGKVDFVQDNESFSSYGVLRGLHFQKPPFAQGKLVRVLQGEVLDVAVDIRIGSSTYGQHVAVQLSDENKRQLWVPRGFAHGYIVLSKTALFAYKCDNYYTPSHEEEFCGMIRTLLLIGPCQKNRFNCQKKTKNTPHLQRLRIFYTKNLNPKTLA